MNKEFKTYKEFINESKELDQSRFPLEDPEEVRKWINENLEGKITDHIPHLTGDWSVDDEGYFSTTGNLNLSKMNLTKLPFKIKFIGGSFRCYKNKLTNFKGLENLKSIGKHFSCYNNQLISLKGLENLEYVGEDFEFPYNQLISLKGLENLEYVGGNLGCNENQLTTLEGLENLKYVGRIFMCYKNQLTSFKGLESLESVGKYFWCYDNQLTSFKGLENLKSVGENFYCHRNKLLSKKVSFEVKKKIKFESSNDPYKYEDSVEYLVSLSQEEQKKIIEDLMDFDPQAYRKLLTYAEENNIELPINKEAYKWNKEAKDLDDTGLEF